MKQRRDKEARLMDKVEMEVQTIEELVRLITDMPEGTMVEVDLGGEDEDGE